MSRKDYVALAHAIKCAGPINAFTEVVALKIAEYAAGDNPNFNRQRFLETCGFTTKA